MRSITVLAAAAALACACSSDADDSSDAPPCDPIAAAAEPVTTSNANGEMSGTLLVPDGCRGMTAVLLLSGSGAQDRDGNYPGDPARTDMYKQLAEGLRDAGFAVLRFDDRGAGSTLPPSVSLYTYDDEVDDAGAWLAQLGADARFGPIAIAGHSLGALSASLLAQRGDTDAVVTLAGGGRPLDEILLEQLAPQLTAAELARVADALATLAAGRLLEPPLLYPVDVLFPPVTQRYWISLLAYDPRTEIAEVPVPVLVVQGGTDVQVTVGDAEQLAAAAGTDAQIIPDMCHPLKQASTRDIAAQDRQYSDPSVPLHPALVPLLAGFLQLH